MEICESRRNLITYVQFILKTKASISMNKFFKYLIQSKKGTKEKNSIYLYL